MADPGPKTERSKPAHDATERRAEWISSLVEEHHGMLYRYAYRLSGSAADAEDLTQQAFMIAQQKIAQLRDADSARSWLFTVLRNCFLKSVRRTRPASAGDLQLDVDEIPDRLATSEEIDSEELQAALGQLPDDFRLVLVMFYFEECSYREISEKLSLPIGTVMSRLSRAKQHLRKQLSPSSEPQQTP
jgi:RNA polymerase sigma-70 factor (ECF subfamily)